MKTVTNSPKELLLLKIFKHCLTFFGLNEFIWNKNKWLIIKRTPKIKRIKLKLIYAPKIKRWPILKENIQQLGSEG